MKQYLAKYQLILKSVLAPILVLLVAQIILAEQKELPAASAQRILQSVRAPNLSPSTSKKSEASPRALTSTPIWVPAQNCPVAIARYGFAQVGGDFYVISGLSASGAPSTGVYKYSGP